MRSFWRPWAVTVALATALGLLANAVRPRDSIDLGRAYFAARAPLPAGGDRPGRPAAPDLEARARASFRVVDADEVLRLREVAAVDGFAVTLVDARGRFAFRTGHIPGALQLDYFNVERDIAAALPFLPLVQLLVVYCESDECEDGLALCHLLHDQYGIQEQRLCLYLGGMRDWRQRQLPVGRGGSLF